MRVTGTLISDISSAAGPIFHEKSSGFAPAAAAKAIFKKLGRANPECRLENYWSDESSTELEF
jgi:hypothetical protein